MKSERPWIAKKTLREGDRDEWKNKKENLAITFDGPLENNEPFPGSPKWKVVAKEQGKDVILSTITFKILSDGIRIGESKSNPEYSGNEIGLRLYEYLIEYAKSKGFHIVQSGDTVRAGAVAVWMKLKDRGYDVRTNPQVSKRYEEFSQAYSEGKYYDRSLDVLPLNESVFELHIHDDFE